MTEDRKKKMENFHERWGLDLFVDLDLAMKKSLIQIRSIHRIGNPGYKLYEAIGQGICLFLLFALLNSYSKI